MPDLPVALSQHRATDAGKALVVLGGRDRSGKLMRQVIRAPLGRNGSYKKWIKGKNLPVGVADHSVGVVNGVIYACGGFQEGGSGGAESNAVWMARVSENGSVAGWKRAADLPGPVHGHAQVVYKNWTYVIGGMAGGQVSQSVFQGDASEGQIRSWNPVLSLPSSLAHAAALVVDRYLVVIGGESMGTGKFLTMPTVYVGPIWQDGSITTWYLASSKLPGAYLGFGRSRTSAGVYGNTLFCFGGQDALFFPLDSIAYATFNVKRGEVGSWGVNQGATGMPQLTSALIWKEHVFLIGGMIKGRVSGKVMRGTFIDMGG